MGSPMAPSHMTLRDFESLKLRSLKFQSIISHKGSEFGHYVTIKH